MSKFKKKAFVLMPFRDPFNSYYKAIFKPALESAGYSVTRADDLYLSRPIMLDVQKSILESDLVLCEMSGRNPNVLYELGLAHAIGKPAILVSNNAEDIPFDLRHLRVILYDSTQAGWENKLRGDIKAFAVAQTEATWDEIWPPPLIQPYESPTPNPAASEFVEINLHEYDRWLTSDYAKQDVDIEHTVVQSAKGDEIFLGVELSRGGAQFYAKTEWLMGHIQVIGSPSSGKTHGIVQPLWYQEIHRNVSTFVLESKGLQKDLHKFTSLATSLAKGHEILYFDPSDPDRSATYNPVLRGTAAEIRQNILASLNWNEADYGSKERISLYLDLIIRAIKEQGRFVSLEEIYQYLSDKIHVHHQLRNINDMRLYDGLLTVSENFKKFQTETYFLSSILREIHESEYAWLLDTDEPDINISEIYRNRKNCLFTLPIQGGAPEMRFLGQLVLHDLMAGAVHANLHPPKDDQNREALLIIDELKDFVNPSFVELLEICRNAKVIVCYTNQSFSELENTNLGLSKAFVDQLANHTNVTFCFHLGSPESIAAITSHTGHERIREKESESSPEKGESQIVVVEPNLIRHLETGHCIVSVRQPRVLGVLKTGHFKFSGNIS